LQELLQQKTDPEQADAIALDVPRTFPEEEMFSNEKQYPTHSDI
jgi:hypothetical protein